MADLRQAERLIEECGLAGSNSMATPGVKSSFQEYEAGAPLENRMRKPFRGSEARSNYLAADGIDLMFAVKEVCRSMSAPTEFSRSPGLSTRTGGKRSTP